MGLLLGSAYLLKMALRSLLFPQFRKLKTLRCSFMKCVSKPEPSYLKEFLD